jgi:hypothetical protein
LIHEHDADPSTDWPMNANADPSTDWPMNVNTVPSTDWPASECADRSGFVGVSRPAPAREGF